MNTSTRTFLSLGLALALVLAGALAIMWNTGDADPTIIASGESERLQQQPRVDEPSPRESRHADEKTEARPEQQSATTEPTALATGRVIDRFSQKPLAGVLVLASDAWPSDPASLEGPRSKTDADGRYELEIAFTDAQASLFAVHPDYASQRRVAWAHRVDRGRRIDGLDFELTRISDACSITAHLTSALGRPIAGAIARLEVDGFHQIGPSPTRAPRETRSDAAGRISFEALAPATYAIAIEAEGLEDHRRVGLKLMRREHKDLGTIVLDSFAWAELAGTITSHDGKPVPDVSVSIPQPRHENRAAKSDANGNYRIPRLAPGTWGVRFEPDGRARVLTRITLAPGSKTRRDLTLPGGDHFIGGRALAGTEPARGFDVTCSPKQQQSGFATSWKTKTDADGRFSIRGLPGGPVDLDFTLASPWTIHSIESVAVDRDDHVIRLPARLPAVQIHGVVKNSDGVPVANATVAPWAAKNDEQRARTGADGRYSITVELTNDASFPIYAEHGDYLSARRMAVYNRADERGRLELDFVLERERATGAVLGRVTDENNRPIADATCLIRTPDKPGTWRAYSDSNGHYRCDQVRAGPLLVSFRHPEYGDYEAKAELLAGSRAEVDATLASNARFSRTIDVFDESNAPLGGSEVHAWRGPLVTWGKTDLHGRVELAKLPAGPIVFSIEHERYSRFEVRHVVDGERQQPIRVRLVGGTGIVHGVVVDANGRARPDVELTLTSNERSGSRVRAVTWAARDGTFRFEHLPDQEYVLEVWTLGKSMKRTVRPSAAAVRLELR